MPSTNGDSGAIVVRRYHCFRHCVMIARGRIKPEPVVYSNINENEVFAPTWSGLNRREAHPTIQGEPSFTLG